ncbi:MAG: hypothetical protein ACO1NS_04925 [Daejeonella sp.]
MAIQTSALFKGFSGSVNRRLLYRQCNGITVLSRFPDRSKVVYSVQQKQAQKRFSEAVEFARVIIREPGLKEIYTVKASLLGFRSAWNVAIAEFMSEEPLGVKRKRIKFDKSLIRRSRTRKMRIRLYRFANETEQSVLKVPKHLKPIRGRDPSLAALKPVIGRRVNSYELNTA